MSALNQIQIRQLTTVDIALTQKLFMLLQEVFEEKEPTKVSEAYAEKLLANPIFVAFAAILNNEPLGGLTGYISPMYNSEVSELYIYDIAIKPEFQRQGIGQRLIDFAKEYCVQNGINTLFVQADAEDDHALEFYRSTGATETKVSHFTYRI